MSNYFTPLYVDAIIYPCRIPLLASAIAVGKRGIWYFHAKYFTEYLSLRATEPMKNRWHIFLKHDDVIKWKHFPRDWPFVRGIHRSLVNSLRKGQSRGALMFSLICAWINGWVNNREAGDLKHRRAHYDIIVINWCVSRHHLEEK